MNKSSVEKVATGVIAIDGIFLLNSNIDIKPDWNPALDNGNKYSVQYRASSAGWQEINQDPLPLMLFDFLVGVRLLREEHLETVTQHPETASDYILAEITATFRGHYRLQQNPQASEQDLKDFADVNVGFDVWPFWREYLQATCLRTGLPLIPLPVYKLSEPKSPKTPRRKTTSK